jgi:hypothetical protein
VTPSEHLWALATERANAPEHMRELFALTIDRATWETADRINYEVGRSVMFGCGLAPRLEQADTGFYASALHGYIQLKLYLHRVVRSIAHSEVWETEVPRILRGEVLKESVRLAEQRDSLCGQIKAARAKKNEAIWGIES